MAAVAPGPVFTQLQPYLAALTEACKEEDGVELTRLVSYTCISRKLAYMFARVRPERRLTHMTVVALLVCTHNAPHTCPCTCAAFIHS